MTALDDAVAAVSMATGPVAPLRTFTASSQAAVLTTRRATVPWAFSVLALRAGVLVSPVVFGRVRVETRDRLRVLRVDVRVRDEGWAWPELSDLLEASLAEGETPASRWRSRIGAAVNGALATEPQWVELHTPAGARRWALDRAASREHDPYEVQRIPTDAAEGDVSLRVGHLSEGVAAAWARWTGRHAPEAAVAKLWSDALGRPIEDEALHEGVLLEPLEGDARSLGDAGTWWPAADGGLHLRREGVRVASVGYAVQSHGGVVLHGELEAPRVRLDADGRNARVDARFHEVVAWLLAEHGGGAFEPPTQVVDSRGQVRTPAALRDVDEVVYAWPHQLQGAPAGVAALTPATLAWLKANTAARFVPARVLAQVPGIERVDLTALEHGAVGPVGLGDGITAYVHRHAVAKQGSVRVHAYGRAVLKRAVDALPGVTVITALPDDDPGVEGAELAAEEAVRRAVACADMLSHAALSAVPEETARWRMPWLVHRWAQLGPQDLQLRYEPHGGGVRLKWRDDPLLGLTVARDREGSSHALVDALTRLRDAGGVVVGDASGRWSTLESDVPAWVPWFLTTAGAEVLQRVVGDWGLWRMPMVAEAQLRPAAIESQPHVRLSAERAAELQGDLGAFGRSSEWARLALLAHALLAHAAGDDAFGVERLELLFAYDPQATQPWHRTSMAALASGKYVGVVPRGASHRGLAGPVLEACPSVAYALVELGLVPVAAAGTRARPGRPSLAPKPVSKRQVWIRQRVMNRLCVGALTLTDGAPGVELWSQGLRARTLRLPPPHHGVSGRVWLQVPSASDAALRTAMAESLAALEEAAAKAALLAVPGSTRAEALRRFSKQVQTRPSEAVPASPSRAPVLGSDRLAATLRFALGEAVTLEVSRVSWSLVRDDPGLARLRLGGLHPWIRAARADDAGAGDIGAAALGVLYALLREGRLSAPRFDQALTRVLAALE